MKFADVRISKFRVKAYRSCKDTVFNPSRSVTALIGPNGAGKTNILSALQLLRIGRRRFRKERDAFSLKCQIESDFTYKRRVVQFKSKIIFRSNETNRDEVIEAAEKWNFKNFGWTNDWLTTDEASILTHSDEHRFGAHQLIVGPAGIARTRYLSRHEYAYLNANEDRLKRYKKPPVDAANAFHAIQNFRSNFSYYSASQFTNPSLCPTSFEIDEDGDMREDYNREGQDHALFIYELYQLYKKNDPAYERYLSLVTKAGVGLIDGLKWKDVKFSSTAYEVQSGGNIINKKRERILIIPTIYIGMSQLSFNQLSEGTLRTLALLFYIVTEKSSVLLIEEPEVCVHHGLLNSLIEIMKQFGREKQIVLSTHSDFIVDTLDPEQVRLVRNDKTKGTTVASISKSMSAREFAALKNYLLTSGTLGEYWKQNGFDA
jgi:AAA15 family ATPase/GTPase